MKDVQYRSLIVIGVNKMKKGLGALLFLLATNTTASALSTDEQQLNRTIEKNMPAQLELLKQSVNINSGSRNIDGVKQVAELYTPFLKKIGFSTQWIDLKNQVNRAGHLVAVKHGDPKGKRILLIGHLDTVFEKDHPLQAYRRKDNYAYGPGVSDMKGGNAVMLFALKALEQNKKLQDANITVVLIGDEESSGKPLTISRKVLREEAKKNDIALGFENAENLTEVVTARRGFASWQMSVKARGGHSSLIFTPQFQEGAILGLSELLLEMKKITEEIPGMTFNPGIVAGGTVLDVNDKSLAASTSGKENIIAQAAISKGEMRFLHNNDIGRLQKKILIKISNLPSPLQGRLIINKENIMPAMEPSKRNENLFKLLAKVNQSLGLGQLKSHNPRFRGGADISYVSDKVAALDGLGAVGGNEHSPQEFMDITQTKLATQRAALLLNGLLETELH